MNTLDIDIWSNKQYNALHECVPSLKAGISLMRALYKSGKHTGLRMYVRDAAGGDTSKNRYYYFENGKLKYDNDNY